MTTSAPQNVTMVPGLLGETIAVSNVEDESVVIISVTDPLLEGSASAAMALTAAIKLYQNLGEAIKYASGDQA